MTKIKVDNLEDAKKMFFEALSNESQTASNILDFTEKNPFGDAGGT